MAYPTKLNNDYLLDNAGINSNVAYLSITLEEYSQLKGPPSIDSLIKLIIDNDPLSEIYYCGNRLNKGVDISFLNKIIKDKNLCKCKCLIKN